MTTDGFQLTCPLPHGDLGTIQMAHGGGGRMMRQLIESVFVPAFANEALEARHDAAVVRVGETRMAFTTDSYVVRPIFFPGGDIGSLAVNGTVNDLAMAGATPLYLSAAFILEEGLPLDVLRTIVASMRDAAREAGVALVTGDTKVVDRGKGDLVFINTAGIGLVPEGVEVAPSRVREGDVILVSGDLGRHGIAIMSVREGLEFEGSLESDCAPLADLVATCMDAGGEAIHCLRDLTRGGLAAALNEIATDARVGMEIREADVPVHQTVAGACEMLGLDPLYVANEGRMVAFVAPEIAPRVLENMRTHPRGEGAACIGHVTAGPRGTVIVQGSIGGRRVLDLPSGEPLPRIC